MLAGTPRYVAALAAPCSAAGTTLSTMSLSCLATAGTCRYAGRRPRKWQGFPSRSFTTAGHDVFAGYAVPSRALFRCMALCSASSSLVSSAKQKECMSVIKWVRARGKHYAYIYIYENMSCTFVYTCFSLHGTYTYRSRERDPHASLLLEAELPPHRTRNPGNQRHPSVAKEYTHIHMFMYTKQNM